MKTTSHLECSQMESQHMDDEYKYQILDFSGIVKACHDTMKVTTGQSILRFLHVIYLFFYSDIITVMVPCMTFGILGSLTNSTLTAGRFSICNVLFQSPKAMAWLWGVILVFDINNQNSPESIEEDRINKPSRPIASGLISPTAASHLLRVMILLTLLISYSAGVVPETLALFVLYWLYDNQGGNEDWFMRNLLAAGGYIFYSLGSLSIVSNHSQTMTAKLWMAVFGLVIFTTIHAQDFRDMEGDRRKGRTTLPIMIGSETGRITLATSIIFWSMLCPYYLGLPLRAYCLAIGLGSFTSLQFISKTDNSSDKKSFHLYCLWVAVILQLPAMAN